MRVTRRIRIQNVPTTENPKWRVGKDLQYLLFNMSNLSIPSQFNPLQEDGSQSRAYTRDQMGSVWSLSWTRSVGRCEIDPLLVVCLIHCLGASGDEETRIRRSLVGLLSIAKRRECPFTFMRSYRYNGFGGKSQGNETMEDCARRELQACSICCCPNQHCPNQQLISQYRKNPASLRGNRGFSRKVVFSPPNHSGPLSISRNGIPRR